MVHGVILLYILHVFGLLTHKQHFTTTAGVNIMLSLQHSIIFYIFIVYFVFTILIQNMNSVYCVSLWHVVKQNHKAPYIFIYHLLPAITKTSFGKKTFLVNITAHRGKTPRVEQKNPCCSIWMWRWHRGTSGLVSGVLAVKSRWFINTSSSSVCVYILVQQPATCHSFKWLSDGGRDLCLSMSTDS